MSEKETTMATLPNSYLKKKEKKKKEKQKKRNLFRVT